VLLKFYSAIKIEIQYITSKIQGSVIAWLKFTSLCNVDTISTAVITRYVYHTGQILYQQMTSQFSFSIWIKVPGYIVYIYIQIY
jgi:hypothetical protein